MSAGTGGSMFAIPEDDYPILVEKKVPILLVLDTSGSMMGAAIDQLNAGLQLFQDAFDRSKGADLELIRAGEIGIVTFGNGGVQVYDLAKGLPGGSGARSMVPAGRFKAPNLVAGGETPMGAAMRQALAIISYQKSEWRQIGQAYYRPMIFLLSDGEPTDAGWEQAAAECKEAMKKKGCFIIPFAVENGNRDKLAKFSSMPAIPLSEVTMFREFFKFLSDSMSSLAQGNDADADAEWMKWAQQRVR
jgi:uncharacterized protein YegL